MTVDELKAHIEQARGSSGRERARRAGELAAALKRLQGAPREIADCLGEQLERRSFDGLVDEGGRSVRRAAVEALLALGYPFALEVRPEDWADYRGGASNRWERAGNVALGVALVVSVSGLAALGFEPLLAAAAAGAGAVNLWAHRRRLFRRSR